MLNNMTYLKDEIKTQILLSKFVIESSSTDSQLACKRTDGVGISSDSQLQNYPAMLLYFFINFLKFYENATKYNEPTNHILFKRIF